MQMIKTVLVNIFIFREKRNWNTVCQCFLIVSRDMLMNARFITRLHLAYCVPFIVPLAGSARGSRTVSIGANSVNKMTQAFVFPSFLSWEGTKSKRDGEQEKKRRRRRRRGDSRSPPLSFLYLSLSRHGDDASLGTGRRRRP